MSPLESPRVEVARQRFFAREGFPADGGYDDTWADAGFGPIPYTMVNTKARADALRVHDLHHVLTGYGTSWREESKISAWELGSGGGGRYPYAWFIALFGLFVGLLALPGATWRAFLRGRGSANLYRERSVEPWLRRTVTDTRAELRVRDEPAFPSTSAVLRFMGWSLLAVAVSAVFVLGSPLLVVLGLMRRLATMRCPLSCGAEPCT